MTELGLIYKIAWMPTQVYKSGLLNAKYIFKSY